MTYVHQKAEAIQLRKQGKTYSEILAQIPVAKSTLSLWLRGVGLSRPQQQRITLKRIAARKKGAEIRHLTRITRQEFINRNAESEVGKISDRELWLIGVSLYWAEGTKEKEYRPGQGVIFSNSDPRMILTFIKWLESLCVPREDIYFELYLHENKKRNLKKIISFWSGKTGFLEKELRRIYYKKHRPNSIRHNQGDLYHGILRVRVKASSTLLRRINGWISGINKHWGIV